MRIGRSLWLICASTVSRRHAVLITKDDRVRVLDDRSLNGVFVNGRASVSQLLADGDEIVIGRSACASPIARPAAEQRRAPSSLGALGATRSACLSQKGGTGKTTAVRTLTDVLGASASTCSPSISIRRATCRTTSTSIPAPPRGVRRRPGRAEAAQAIHDDVIPANLSLAEADSPCWPARWAASSRCGARSSPLRARYDLILLDCAGAA